MEGSSSISSLGRLIRARPMASICCSPPERVPAICLMRSFSRGEEGVDLLQVLLDGVPLLGEGAHLQVLLDGHLEEDPPPFGDQGQAPLHHLVAGDLGQALPHEIDGAGLAPQQAGDGVQGGGLPRAVGADEGDHLPLIYLKGDPLMAWMLP